MQVYKAFFKVIKKNISQIIIYVIIFLFFAVFLTSVAGNTQNTSFEETKCNMVFINYDKSSRLAEGLGDYLSRYANLVNIGDDAQKLKDALFFRQIEYIVKVPENFTKELLDGKDVKLDKTAVPDSTTSIYIDNIINKYLNTARTYSNNVKDLSEDQLILNIEKDLSQEVQVTVNSFGRQTGKAEKSAYYFNYLAYSLFAILILGVSCVMLVFNDTDLKKRNLCSPLKLKNMNFQMLLGNFSFALLSWFIMIIASFVLYGTYMFTVNGLLLLLNSLIFTIAALSISFLIGNTVKSRGAMSAAANVVSLGCCFISGVFVPQAILGEKVLAIASFTPTYWYIKANNDIVRLVNFKMENLLPVFYDMLIVIGFAAAVLAVTLAVIKQKRVSV